MSVVYYIVIAYDITDDKRRKRISEILERYGDRVQLSVFECKLPLKKYLRLKRTLEKLIKISEDRIYFYLLPEEVYKRTERLGGAIPLIDRDIIIV